MKVKITYSLSTAQEVIELADYGYADETKWSDLTREEQQDITDGLSLDNIVITSAKEINE